VTALAGHSQTITRVTLSKLQDIVLLTALISVKTGISVSSSSDSSSELDSSSDELESCDATCFSCPVKLPSTVRRLVNRSPAGLAVPLYLLTKTFFSFGGRVLVEDDWAGADIPTRDMRQ
jgi:hypothetical protein